MAKWNLITFEQFLSLEGEDQSRLVAAYETAMMIEAVSSKEAQKEANRKGKRGRH